MGDVERLRLSQGLRFTRLYHCNIIQHLVLTYHEEVAQTVEQPPLQMVHHLVHISLEAYCPVQFFQD